MSTIKVSEETGWHFSTAAINTPLQQTDGTIPFSNEEMFFLFLFILAFAIQAWSFKNST